MSDKKRVVAWSTGTVGRHAIAGIDARPDLELVGCWVSSDAKAGQDAGRLAGLDRDLGVIATNDKEELFALEPDCIVHTAMVDDRIFEAMDDLTEMVERGINVVSSGPVLLCYPQGLGLDELVQKIDDAELTAEAREDAGVLADLLVAGDPAADQLEVGAGVDAGDGVAPDRPGRPGDHPLGVAHFETSRSGSPRSRFGCCRPPSTSSTLPVTKPPARLDR